jgi:hypothetical protein
MAIKSKLMTRVHFLPNRSAATPKMTAPTDRKRSVRVMAVVMAVVFFPNCTPSLLAVRLTLKYYSHARIARGDDQRDR